MEEGAGVVWVVGSVDVNIRIGYIDANIRIGYIDANIRILLIIRIYRSVTSILHTHLPQLSPISPTNLLNFSHFSC